MQLKKFLPLVPLLFLKTIPIPTDNISDAVASDQIPLKTPSVKKEPIGIKVRGNINDVIEGEDVLVKSITGDQIRLKDVLDLYSANLHDCSDDLYSDSVELEGKSFLVDCTPNNASNLNQCGLSFAYEGDFDLQVRIGDEIFSQRSKIAMSLVCFYNDGSVDTLGMSLSDYEDYISVKHEAVFDGVAYIDSISIVPKLPHQSSIDKSSQVPYLLKGLETLYGASSLTKDLRNVSHN